METISVIVILCFIIMIIVLSHKSKDAEHELKLKEEYKRGKTHAIYGAREILGHSQELATLKNSTVPAEYTEYAELVSHLIKKFFNIGYEKGYKDAVSRETERLSSQNWYNEEIIRKLKKTLLTLEKENDLLKTSQSKTEPTSAREQKSDVILTQEFKSILRQLEKTNDNIFITGKAGTGKSTLLQYFRKRTKKHIVILAPTGLAAINVGGQTIHSFFKLPPRLITDEELKNIRPHSILRYVDMIIIDEISMLRADLLDGIDKILRNAKRNNNPFGGTQMVFFGDLYQLPPVVKDGNEAIYLTNTYGGSFFFNAPAIAEMNLKHRELSFIFRQKDDDDFKSILNRFRINKLTDDDFKIINSRVVNTHLTDELSVMLCPTRMAAKKVNDEHLARLSSKYYEYKAIIKGNHSIFTNDPPVETVLKLKVGAQIMMLKNDSQRRWVNGTLGKIHALFEESIQVDIDGTVDYVERETWEGIKYIYNRETRTIEAKVIGEYIQYPIGLAWAITVHKSQGQTFENVTVDLNDQMFAHGQAYVAFSRCPTLNGIKIKGKLKHGDIRLDNKVIQYIRAVNENSSHKQQQ